MRKSNAHLSIPGPQAPTIARPLKHYHRNTKKITGQKKPEQPTEEIIDRLNIIGKTYPFCVYYRQQVNDPL